MEFSVMHNGSTNLPLKTVEMEDGKKQVIPDASVREVHEDAHEVVRDQVEHGVLAEEYGYDRVAWTEHHFQVVGAEFSPDPIGVGMAVASQTDEIEIGQFANIVTWHDPVRLAERTAMLDIMSDGRAAVGVGRGYQPREAEVLGDQYFGGTIQDQEKNRVVYHESVELLQKAWTEDLFRFEGEHHYVPPQHTKWHHDQEKAYLNDDVTEFEVEDMMDWAEGDVYSKSGAWTPVTSGGTTLKRLSVFPQPQQKPHPQLWLPATSYRSIKWAARNAVNCISFGDPNVGKKMDVYMEAAEEADWPDIDPEKNGEPFKWGYDEARKRGMIIGRWIFNMDASGADEETYERWKKGLEHGWDYFGPFGFARGIVESGDPSDRADAERLIETGVAIGGDSDHIIDQISKLKENTGTEDLGLCAFFEVGGLSGEEANEQLKVMSEKVFPYLNEEFPSPEASK